MIAWHRRVVPRGLWWAALLLAAVATTAVVWQLWMMLAVVVVPVVQTARSIVDVTVDASGLTVRGILGRPRVHVPAHRIEHVEAVPAVSPAQYVEGHGWHSSRGATRGVVVRRGEALIVDRAGEAPLVVTVDDADSGAAALLRSARSAQAV